MPEQGVSAGVTASWHATSKEASSSSIGSTETSEVGGSAPMHSASASRSGSRKQRATVEGEASLVSAGAPMLMYVAGTPLRRRRRLQRRRLSSAPPMPPCAVPSEVGGLPRGACWEAGGLSTPLNADLDRLQSLTRWPNPRQRRQRHGNRQVATRCE
jgi:hypothetical protein